MLYPDDIIEEVRVRNDIVDVISEYAGLKKAGNSYKCCCPAVVQEEMYIHLL